MNLHNDLLKNVSISFLNKKYGTEKKNKYPEADYTLQTMYYKQAMLIYLSPTGYYHAFGTDIYYNLGVESTSPRTTTVTLYYNGYVHTTTYANTYNFYNSNFLQPLNDNYSRMTKKIVKVIYFEDLNIFLTADGNVFTFGKYTDDNEAILGLGDSPTITAVTSERDIIFDQQLMLAGDTKEDPDLTLEGIVDISVGINLLCILNTDGKILFTGWADRSGIPGVSWNTVYNKPVYAHVGDGTFDSEYVYNSSSTYSERFVQICSGHYFHIALTDDGYIYSGGTNDNYGQLGYKAYNSYGFLGWVYDDEGTRIATIQGDVEEKFKVVPFIRIPGLKKITHISCSMHHTCCCDTYGNAYSFGNNDRGQLGHHDEDTFYQTPDQVLYDDSISGTVKIKYVACGRRSTHLLSDDGILYSCGDNDYNQILERNDSHIAFTSRYNKAYPYKILNLSNSIEILSNVVNIFATHNSDFIVILTDSNTVYTNFDPPTHSPTWNSFAAKIDILLKNAIDNY